MRIEVTENDILKGKRGNAFNCPIALALKRALPTAREIVVCRRFIDINGKTYKPSKEIIKFLRRYDSYMEVEPFAFDLDDLNLW